MGQQERTEGPVVVVAGGGTGGHLYPGVAVIEELAERFDGLQPEFVGTDQGIEARVVPSLGYPFHSMDVPPMKGRSWSEWISGGLSLGKSGVQATKLLGEIDPDLVIGVGGYAAGPFTLASALSGRPTVLMEQNAQPGVTNRILSRFVDRAFVAFEETCRQLADVPCEVVGNPVRRSLRQTAVSYSYEAPADGEPIRMLVTGGSGGAKSLNTRLPEALINLGTTAQKLEVKHQYGRGRRSEVTGRYDGFEGDVELVEFIDDMAEAYRWAHLVMCRAGASTIAEIMTFGLPAIYVPSPHVADDHQSKNAKEIAEAGAGVSLSDDAIGTGRATRLLQGLLENPVSLENLAERARSLAQPDAASDVADALSKVLGENH
jgi:UDP-N-acetylglucosamine--N-acetylmuramyl-(pentapeptide) pyrophosphoryl-undecaprenol N-acetylglucosamine transferase